MSLPFPEAALFDYGGTLVEELRFDWRAGHDWLMARATMPARLTASQSWEHVCRVVREVMDRRDEHHVETPWLQLSRLMYQGVSFAGSEAELALGFWRAAVETRPIPGARDMLERLTRAGVKLGVLSNASFGADAIRAELEKHGLAEYFAEVMVSAEYGVRKPNPLLFEAAAARLGVAPARTWFAGDRLDTDVAGARAAGMTAIWFNATGKPAPSTPPDLTIAAWPELTLPERGNASAD